MKKHLELLKKYGFKELEFDPGEDGYESYKVAYKYKIKSGENITLWFLKDDPDIHISWSHSPHEFDAWTVCTPTFLEFRQAINHAYEIIEAFNE